MQNRRYFMSSFFATALAAVMSLGTAGITFAAIDDGLVGLYGFNDCTAKDGSGNGNNGVIVGRSQCVQGVNGSALKFGGVYDRGYVNIPNTPSLSFLDNYTFTLWFNIGSYTSMDGWGRVSDYGLHTLFAKAGDRNGLDLRTGRMAGEDSLYLWAYSGWCCGGGGGSLATVDRFQLNEWHMATITSGNGEVKLYLDCKLQASMPIPQFNVNPAMSNMPLQLGIDQGAVWYPIDGVLDETRVYRRALSDKEVIALYRANGGTGVCKGENQPPVAAAGPDQTVECAGPNGTTVTLDGSGSSDPDGDALAYTWTWIGGTASGVSPSVTLPLGTHEITLTVGDGKGGTATDTVTVAVRDTTPPVTTVRSIAGIAGSSGWYTSDVLITVESTDSCSGAREIGSSIDGNAATTPGGTATIPVQGDGSHVVTFGATDNAGNVEQPKSLTIKIDKTAPTADISVTPGLLWPPNHKMVDIAVNGGSSDGTSGVASVVITVTDEYGIVQPVISGFNTTVPLEAWREGTDRDGRHYTITATITDAAGNTTVVSTEAVCPHDMRNKQ